MVVVLNDSILRTARRARTPPRAANKKAPDGGSSYRYLLLTMAANH